MSNRGINFETPEIMCSDKNCALRMGCRRFRGIPKKDQNYFKKSPLWNDECNFFLKIGYETMQEAREAKAEDEAEQRQDLKPY